MLFAIDWSADTTTLAGVIIALIVAVVVWLTAKLNANTRLQRQIDSLQEKSFDAVRKHGECLELSAELKAVNIDLQHEIKGHIRRIARLEKHAGIDGEPKGGIVVADLNGIIRVFSPSLVPLFKYLPMEVIGKPLTVLMAAVDVTRHVPAFQRFVSDSERQADPKKVILGTGRDKVGEEFPVAIMLESWQVGAEGLITAYVSERVQEPPAEILHRNPRGET